MTNTHQPITHWYPATVAGKRPTARWYWGRAVYVSRRDYWRITKSFLPSEFLSVRSVFCFTCRWPSKALCCWPRLGSYCWPSPCSACTACTVIPACATFIASSIWAE